LIPLAIGLNIDFATLFSDFNPHIFIGGDSVAFWGPLSWTMIYGLSFATILTLVVLPVMYLLSENASKKFRKMLGLKPKPEHLVPEVTAIEPGSEKIE
jgi:ABC-type Fe3+ transport system permease subunit